MRSLTRSSVFAKITPAAPSRSRTTTGRFLGCPSTSTMAPDTLGRSPEEKPPMPSPSSTMRSPVPTSTEGRSASVPRSTSGARRKLTEAENEDVMARNEGPSGTETEAETGSET